jgi:DNA-directed RNA polymerase specialized sigma24 family protein
MWQAEFTAMTEDIIFLQQCLKTVLRDYNKYFKERFVDRLSIRKYAQEHNLNRGSVDYIQKKMFTALAAELKARDEADGKCRLCDPNTAPKYWD